MGIVNNTKNLEQCSQSGVNVPYEELVYPLQFIKIFNWFFRSVGFVTNNQKITNPLCIPTTKKVILNKQIFINVLLSKGW